MNATVKSCYRIAVLLQPPVRGGGRTGEVDDRNRILVLLSESFATVLRVPRSRNSCKTFRRLFTRLFSVCFRLYCVFFFRLLQLRERELWSDGERLFTLHGTSKSWFWFNWTVCVSIWPPAQIPDVLYFYFLGYNLTILRLNGFSVIIDFF